MLKRLIDLFFSLTAIILLFPILLFIILIVRLESSGPAIFRQERVGRGGHIFTIYKIRTMANVSEVNDMQVTIGGDPRITKIGSFLRDWKLDELPQLWNVIRGDMSLVGPRPEVLRYVNLYPTDVRDIVLSVRPGITDPCSMQLRKESELLAQQTNPTEYYINILIPYKLNIYTQYIKNQSNFRDFRILIKTIYFIFK